MPAEKDPAYERVGTILKEKWQLEKLLGLGGSAAVYAASHVNNGRRVAVKILHTELCARKDLVRRFLREGYFANKIGHPCAVAVLDDDKTDDGAVFLVLELLEGHSLDRYTRGKERLPTHEVLRITDDVLDLLAVAHAEGVIHRDVKPANIFLTKTGQVKVLDFGIARLAEAPEAAQGQTQLGTGIGTPSFMSPEQARGRWNIVDGRSDIWALGATMFSLITGHKPREAETANEELLIAMTAPMPSLGDVARDVHPAIVALVDKALSFEMSERWASAKAMQAALRDVIQDVEADPDFDPKSFPAQGGKGLTNERFAPQNGGENRASDLPGMPTAPPPALGPIRPAAGVPPPPPAPIRPAAGAPPPPPPPPPPPRASTPVVAAPPPPPPRNPTPLPSFSDSGESPKHDATPPEKSLPPTNAGAKRRGFVPPPFVKSTPAPEPVAAAAPAPPPPPPPPPPPTPAAGAAARAPAPSLSRSPQPSAARPLPAAVARARQQIPSLQRTVPANPPFSVPANRLALCQDQQHGFILVGPHLPEGKPPRVRAYSLKNAAVAWQALNGEEWLDQLNEIMSIGRLLFISIRSRVQCFDLISGREWWSLNIPAKFQLNPSGANRGPKLYDASSNGHPLLLAKTAGNFIVAIDPTTGQEVARRSFPSPVDLELIEGNQVAVVRYTMPGDKEKGVLEFIAPSTLQSTGGIVKGMAQDAIIRNAWTGGTWLAAEVEKWGLLGAHGMVVFDAISRRELFFEREKAIDQSIHPVFFNNRVYYVTQAQEIRMTPGSARLPVPIAGCRIAAIAPVGNALFVGIEDMSGNAQVMSLDPNTLQMRTNFGMLAPWTPTARLSNREPGRFFTVYGNVAAFISPSQDGAQEGDLTVVDGNTGSVLWQRPLPDCWPVEDFYASGGAIVVWSTKNLLILDAMSGETIGVYPPQ